MHRLPLVVSLLISALFFSPFALSESVTGLVVEEVIPDSPAAKVGLKTGDRLLSYGGAVLPTSEALAMAEQKALGKKEVELRVQRGEEALTLTAPPGKLGISVRPHLPQAAVVLYEEGRAAQKANKADESLGKWALAAKAAEEAGDRLAAAWLYCLLGGTYGRLDRCQEALSAIKQAVSVKPDSAEAQASLGWALGHLGRWQEGAEAYERETTMRTCSMCRQSLSCCYSSEEYGEGGQIFVVLSSIDSGRS